MSKFIDADRIDWRLIIPTNVTTAEENMIHLAKKLVERQPTADVVEVVHGEWIDKGEDYMIRWTCSNCGRRDTHIYDFCPDCGADMRGEEDVEIH